jgi:F-type H+-transporting ATPase subunit b
VSRALRTGSAIALVAGAGLLFSGLVPSLASEAAAQPAPPAGQPAPPPARAVPDGQPGMPRPRLAQPGQPGQPGQAQPGQRPSRGPGIQPGFPPGFDPGGGRRPMAPLPAGHPPVAGQEVAGAPKPAKPMAPRDAHGHCIGHGPMDSLREHSHINWYQGLLGVDNEKAKSSSFADRLFWRYYNPTDECDPDNQQPPVLASAFNFLILLLLLVKFGRKPLAEALAKRKKAIVEDMVAARAQGDEAEERLERYEAQLGRLEDRRLEIEEEAALQWEAEKKRILGEADERRLRMRRDAEIRVEQELKAAQQELLREAIEGAAEAARKLVATRLEARDHERLADEYLASVGNVIREGGTAARPAGPAGGAS